MEVALDTFCNFYPNLELEDFCEHMRDASVTLAIKHDELGNYLYLALANIKRLVKEKEITITGSDLYYDINCTQLANLHETSLKITQVDLIITERAFRRITVIIHICLVFFQRYNLLPLMECHLKHFFLKKTCTSKGLACILHGIDPRLFIPEKIDEIAIYDQENNLRKFITEIKNKIQIGCYDGMEWPNLFYESIMYGYRYLAEAILFHVFNQIELFNTYEDRSPLKMLEEYLKSGFFQGSLSAHQKLIIKVLIDIKQICSESFNKDYPILSKFLDENKEVQNISSDLEKNLHLSKAGEKGGRANKKNKAIVFLVSSLLKQKMGLADFIRLLKNKHFNKDRAYKGFGDSCYNIYISESRIFYSTVDKNGEQHTAINTLSGYFSKERKKLKETASDIA